MGSNDRETDRQILTYGNSTTTKKKLQLEKQTKDRQTHRQTSMYTSDHTFCRLGQILYLHRHTGRNILHLHGADFEGRQQPESKTDPLTHKPFKKQNAK